MREGQQLLEAVDERGEIGILDLATRPEGAAANENVLAVRLGDGATVFVSADYLSEIATDKYRFRGSFADVRRDSPQPPTFAGREDSNGQNTGRQNLAAPGAPEEAGGRIVVPLIAEVIRVGRKTVETGGVRVHKTVREDVRTIDEPVVREHVEVERVAVNQFVETAPAVRYEGDVMIVPVLEEVVVTQKRLLLREEIRLVKRREEISSPQEITLRREEINLENIDAESDIEPGTPAR